MKPLLIIHGLIAVCCLSGLLFAQPDPKAKPEAWIVIETGKGHFEVIEASTLPEVKKSQEEDYKKALDSWTKAKAEAKKEKKDFKEPKPEKPTAKKVAGPFKSQEEAQKALDKHKSKDKKKDKEPGHA